MIHLIACSQERFRGTFASLRLYVHVGTTGRYHNESLDSLTIILLYGSFLKIVISIYSLIIVYMRLVMFIKRICYVSRLAQSLK